jgi:hypothetical protein
MGREARCYCEWPGGCGPVTLHLDANELRVRGAWRATFAIANARDVHADGSHLRLRFGEDWIALELGADEARRWVAALAKPAPSLAHKLGIDTPAARVLALGPNDDEVLAAALTASRQVANAHDATIVVCRADTPSELAAALDRVAVPDSKAAIWIVYPKGRASSLSESEVRTFMRACGFVDTKVASVSDRLTALRFTRRRPS